jgi:putative hydrolase of HD superfamily
MAIYALLLHRETAISLDIGHVLELVLTHDLVEIYAGDTYAHDWAAREAARASEAEAAVRLFSQLPPDLGLELRGWWEEFEGGATSEAAYARAVDRLQAFAQGVFSGGRSWRERGVTEAMTLRLNESAMGVDPAIRAAYESLYERARRLELFASTRAGQPLTEPPV